MCVAEVIPFAETETRSDSNAPDWLIGSIDWNGRKLPVVSFDSASSDESMIIRRRGARSRVVVFHAIGDRAKLRHYGVLTQGFPQLVRVNRDVITLDPDGSIPPDQPILCRVRMIHEFPLIPDLETLEDRLAGLAADWVN
jgi:chemosensory pili system protein ChpC